MKIIDLLNKIANGEEVPEKIKYRNTIFIYDKDNQCYVVENYNEYYDLHMSLSNHKGTDLNYEVEILEEEKKVPTLNDIRKSYNLSRIEEKKIPEKLKLNETGSIDFRNKINEIIDYLKSKGE